MEAKKPKFRIMKVGYDRFAVDDAIDRLQFELDAKEKQLQSYSKQIEFFNFFSTLLANPLSIIILSCFVK